MFLIYLWTTAVPNIKLHTDKKIPFHCFYYKIIKKQKNVAHEAKLNYCKPTFIPDNCILYLTRCKLAQDK